MTPNNHSISEEDSTIDQLLAFYGANEYLSNNKLYKVYLLCPKLSNHIVLKSNNLASFLASFQEHLRECASCHSILFEEDYPHRHHQFSQPDTSLLVLLVPPNLIVYVDGSLLLQAERIILESILGVYLNAEEEKFYRSAHFNMEKVRQWIGEVPEATMTTDIPPNVDYA